MRKQCNYASCLLYCTEYTEHVLKLSSVFVNIFGQTQHRNHEWQRHTIRTTLYTHFHSSAIEL